MRLTKRYLKRLVLEALEDASPSEDEDPPYQSSYPGGEHTSFMDEFRAGPPQEVEDVAKELADLYWNNKGQPDTEEIKEMLEKLRSLGMHGVDKAQDLAMTKGGSQRWSYPPGGFDESLRRKTMNINKRTLKRLVREQASGLFAEAYGDASLVKDAIKKLTPDWLAKDGDTHVLLYAGAADWFKLTKVLKYWAKLSGKEEQDRIDWAAKAIAGVSKSNGVKGPKAGGDLNEDGQMVTKVVAAVIRNVMGRIKKLKKKKRAKMGPAGKREFTAGNKYLAIANAWGGYDSDRKNRKKKRNLTKVMKQHGVKRAVRMQVYKAKDEATLKGLVGGE